MSRIKFYGLHYFGDDRPLAILSINGHQGLYDQPGIENLIYKESALNHDINPLIEVLDQFQTPPYFFSGYQAPTSDLLAMY